MIEMRPEEAFLVFEKWYADEAQLFCKSRLFGWAFVLKGKVSSLSRKEVSLTSMGGGATLTLPFGAEDLIFGYAELRESDPGSKVGDTSGLTVALPLRFAQSDLNGPLRAVKRELLTFAELRDKSLSEGSD